MNLRMQQLPSQQRPTLFGLRTDAQRLSEMELVFAAMQHATKALRARSAWHDIGLSSLAGQRFWYLPLSLFPAIVTGLPAAALETLSLVAQICAQTDEAAVALLLPNTMVKLLYLSDAGMRGQTYARSPAGQK